MEDATKHTEARLRESARLERAAGAFKTLKEDNEGPARAVRWIDTPFGIRIVCEEEAREQSVPLCVEKNPAKIRGETLLERVESGSNVFHLRLPACWLLLLHGARLLRIVVATTAAYP